MTRRQYVAAVLDDYARLSDTPDRPTTTDRRLAARLWQRQVPLTTVRAALLLATARRAARPPSAPPLNPIRSLAYVLPILEELRLSPPDPDYLAHLQQRLRHPPTPPHPR